MKVDKKVENIIEDWNVLAELMWKKLVSGVTING